MDERQFKGLFVLIFFHYSSSSTSDNSNGILNNKLNFSVLLSNIILKIGSFGLLPSLIIYIVLFRFIIIDLKGPP